MSEPRSTHAHSAEAVECGFAIRAVSMIFVFPRWSGLLSLTLPQRGVRGQLALDLLTGSATSTESAPPNQARFVLRRVVGGGALSGEDSYRAYFDRAKSSAATARAKAQRRMQSRKGCMTGRAQERPWGTPSPSCIGVYPTRPPTAWCLVDMHARHMTVMYERMKNGWREKRRRAQLLIPPPVRILPAFVSPLQASRPRRTRGFAGPVLGCRPRRADHWRCPGYSRSRLAGRDPRPSARFLLLSAMLAQRPLARVRIDQMHLLATMACHAAVRAQRILTLFCRRLMPCCVNEGTERADQCQPGRRPGCGFRLTDVGSAFLRLSLMLEAGGTAVGGYFLMGPPRGGHIRLCAMLLAYSGLRSRLSLWIRRRGTAAWIIGNAATRLNPRPRIAFVGGAPPNRHSRAPGRKLTRRRFHARWPLSLCSDVLAARGRQTAAGWRHDAVLPPLSPELQSCRESDPQVAARPNLASAPLGWWPCTGLERV